MYQFHKSDRFPYLLQLSPTKTGSIRVFYATGGGTRIILVTNIHNHLNSAKSWQEKRMR